MLNCLQKLSPDNYFYLKQVLLKTINCSITMIKPISFKGHTHLKRSTPVLILLYAMNLKGVLILTAFNYTVGLYRFKNAFSEVLSLNLKYCASTQTMYIHDKTTFLVSYHYAN